MSKPPKSKMGYFDYVARVAKLTHQKYEVGASRDWDKYVAGSWALGRPPKEAADKLLSGEPLWAPKRNPPSSSPAMRAAQRAFVATHWGEGGKKRLSTLHAPDPSAFPLVELGELVAVVYRTKKGGDDAPTDYEHKFSGPLPVLAYHAGGLVICGGRYRITVRGIEG